MNETRAPVPAPGRGSATMTRRIFRILLAWGAGLAIAAAATPPRPANILFIVADEYRHDCLGAAGHPIVKTPFLDRLAQQGTLFTHAYTASPVCSPARATLFTGRYPQAHGVRQNNLPFNPGERTLPPLLRAQGYRTGITGKLHLQAGDDWFDYAQVTDGGRGDAYLAFLRASKQFIKGTANSAAVPETVIGAGRTPLKIGRSVLPEDKFEEAWVAARAIEFLRAQARGDRPWFLFLSLFKPHSEYVIPAPFDTMYRAADLPLPRTFRTDAREPAPKDRSAAKDDAGGRARMRIDDAEILRAVTAHYYGAVTMVDKYIGRVLAAVDELGLADDTVVVFTADHGNMLGERNRMFKGVMYESSVRVPLIVRAPGRVRAGAVLHAAIDNTAIMPTVLELAGLAIPAGVQGRSLVPLLRGEGPAPPAAFSWLNDRMVLADDWKLIVPVKENRGGPRELYHLPSDPDEQVNLYDRPRGAAAQKSLLAQLARWEASQPAVTGGR